MTKRRLLSLALLFTLLDPLALLATTLKGAHECSDHVCACARRARSAARPCHGSEAETPGMQAACSHDTEPVLLRSALPALSTLEPSLQAVVVSDEIRASAGEQRRAGFNRVDSPPPRSL